jgi:hypothetical protein
MIVSLAGDGNPDVAVVLSVVFYLILVLLGVLLLLQIPTSAESRRSHLTILRWNWLLSEEIAFIASHQSDMGA